MTALPGTPEAPEAIVRATRPRLVTTAAVGLPLLFFSFVSHVPFVFALVPLPVWYLWGNERLFRAADGALRVELRIGRIVLWTRTLAPPGSGVVVRANPSLYRSHYQPVPKFSPFSTWKILLVREDGAIFRLWTAVENRAIDANLDAIKNVLEARNRLGYRA